MYLVPFSNMLRLAPAMKVYVQVESQRLHNCAFRTATMSSVALQNIYKKIIGKRLCLHIIGKQVAKKRLSKYVDFPLYYVSIGQQRFSYVFDIGDNEACKMRNELARTT